MSGKINSAIRSFFEKHVLTCQNIAIAVAVSGGPDSMALAHSVNKVALEHSITCRNVTLDHSLRFLNVSENPKWVKHTLIGTGIGCDILKVDDCKWDHLKKGEMMEKARVMRYMMLLNYCKEQSINLLLTGHQAEDQIATFFMRMSKCSGIHGLSSIKYLSQFPIADGDILLGRPFLEVSKDELIDYCKSMNIDYLMDDSNSDLSYLRNSINQGIGRLMKTGLVSYAELLKVVEGMNHIDKLTRIEDLL